MSVVQGRHPGHLVMLGAYWALMATCRQQQKVTCVKESAASFDSEPLGQGEIPVRVAHTQLWFSSLHPVCYHSGESCFQLDLSGRKALSWQHQQDAV